MSRGKPVLHGVLADTSGRLQFGHGCEPWKTSAPGAVMLPGLWLQFGHGCEPWKTAVEHDAIDPEEIDASIRPRL